MAYHVKISHGSAYEIIHNRLGFHKVYAIWVKKQLTEEHRHNRVATCQCLLGCYANEGEAFMKQIVTGDETCIHHFESESKLQSMEWKHPEFLVKKKLKSNPLQER